MTVCKKDFRTRNLCHSGQGPGIHGYFSAGIEKRLVHVESYNYVNDALRREKQLKWWRFCLIQDSVILDPGSLPGMTKTCVRYDKNRVHDS
ncbi:MAG: hypothetical protein WCW33_03860 [Candidatus Babeliales bacterium]